VTKQVKEPNMEGVTQEGVTEAGILSLRSRNIKFIELWGFVGERQW